MFSDKREAERPEAYPRSTETDQQLKQQEEFIAPLNNAKSGNLSNDIKENTKDVTDADSQTGNRD